MKFGISIFRSITVVFYFISSLERRKSIRGTLRLEDAVDRCQKGDFKSLIFVFGCKKGQLFVWYIESTLLNIIHNAG